MQHIINKNIAFESNDNGIEIINKKRSNSYKFFVIVIPLFFIFSTLFYIQTDRMRLIFYTIGIPFLLSYFGYNIYTLLLSLKRCSRTIANIEFRDQDTTFNTFSGKIYDSKHVEFNLNQPEFKIKSYKFPWYENGKLKEGAKIIVRKDEFYLIKDFFDDYDTIIINLKKT